jgi:hypothetical protein
MDVVYVGYPVDTSWGYDRPRNVSTLHIDRGSYPETAPANARTASTVKVDTAPVRNSAIRRGGLGVPSGQQQAQTRTTGTPAIKAATVTKAATPPPPSKRPNPPVTVKAAKR